MCKHGFGFALYPPPKVGGFTATDDKYDEPLKLQFALERLEAKLPDYAKGEILPPPKTEHLEIKPPDRDISR